MIIIDTPTPIPGYSSYLASRDGKIYSLKRNRHLKSNLRFNGYQYIALAQRTIPLHRLICMTFKPVENYQALQVNHIDGDKSNNHIDNLEWTTGKENVAHGVQMGFYTDRVPTPVTVRDVRTNTVIQFPSVHACGKHYNMHVCIIRLRLLNKEGATRIWPEGRQYRVTLEDDNTPWYTHFDNNIENGIKMWSNQNGVDVKNVDTEDQFCFDSQAAAARYFGLGIMTMTQRLGKDKNIVYPGGWMFKRSSDLEDWGLPDRIGYGVKERIIATNSDTGLEEIYNSILDCSYARGVKPTALNWRIKDGVPGKVYRDGYSYRYADR